MSNDDDNDSPANPRYYSPSSTSRYYSLNYSINNNNTSPPPPLENFFSFTSISQDDLSTEFENDFSFMINFINQRLNNNNNSTLVEEEQETDQLQTNDDDVQEDAEEENERINPYYYDILNNSNEYINQVVTNLLRNIDTNDNQFNDDMDYVLSVYRGNYNTLETVLNQSFEEAPTISKNENQEINLQQVIYTKIDVDETCTICLSVFENGDSIGHLDCNHIFHFECINEWCKYKSQCPMCREEVQIK
jgi:hypothetical protein